MNNPYPNIGGEIPYDLAKLKVKTEIVRRYYVEQDGWIYGGPFDTKEEANQCLKKAKGGESDE